MRCTTSPLTNGGELKTSDGAVLSLDELTERYLASLPPAQRDRLFPGGLTDHFAIELHDIFEAVRTGTQPEVNGDEGLNTLAMPLAVYESGYSGQAVAVADILSGKAHAYQDEIDAHWPVCPHRGLVIIAGSAAPYGTTEP